MISVTKDFNTPPVKLSCAECLDKIRNAVTVGNTHRFDSSYYRKGSLAELKTIYKTKCGYCETNPEAGATFRIDHFRPKKFIKDVVGHTGYYWLAYEWSNLVLACDTCNNKKSNKFPLANGGIRINLPVIAATGLPENDYLNINSNFFLGEMPLLLNPEIDIVENDLVFLPSGKIKGITPRGRKTIEVCSLNRDPLFTARKKIIDLFLSDIRKCIANYLAANNSDLLKYSLKDVFVKIKSSQDPDNAYSRLGWFMYHKFHLFFTNKLGLKQQVIIRQAFNLFLNNQL